jgi:hypothetical protein
MERLNQRHVNKGKGERNNALKEQSIYTFGLAEKDHAVLIQFGLGADTLSTGRTCLVRFCDLLRDRELMSDNAALTFEKENGARSRTSKLVRTLRLAAKLALQQDVPEDKQIIDAIMAGNLKGSTRRMLDYLDNIRPRVAAVEERLKPHFQGESPLAKIDEARAALEQADCAQEMQRTELPTKTLELYEVKGRLLESIERINRVARLAFDGRADVIARYNKDILLRARQASAQQPAPGTVTTPI